MTSRDFLTPPSSPRFPACQPHQEECSGPNHEDNGSSHRCVCWRAGIPGDESDNKNQTGELDQIQPTHASMFHRYHVHTAQHDTCQPLGDSCAFQRNSRPKRWRRSREAFWRAPTLWRFRPASSPDIAVGHAAFGLLLAEVFIGAAELGMLVAKDGGRQ